MTINTTTRRAAAEGFTLAAVKAAMSRVQAREVADAEAKAGVREHSTPETWSPDRAAAHITSDVRYCGGYMYPGTVWSHGLDKLQPRQWHSHSSPDVEGGSPADVVAALKALPVGTVVTEFTDAGNGKSYSYFRVEVGGWLTLFASSSEADDDFWCRRVNYATPYSVARELGIVVSPTFLAVLEEAGNL